MIDADVLTALPAQMPLDLVRKHCHLDSFSPPVTLDDTLLTMYVLAAVRWFEGETQRAMIARPHRWILRGFPCGCDHGKLRLPLGKVQSVESIVCSVNHAPVTLTGPSASPPGSDFQQELRGNAGGVLMPAVGSSWPSVDHDVVSPIVVSLTAGWAGSTVPEDIIQACLFYVSDCVEMRGTPDIDMAVLYSGSNFKTRELLISGWRLRHVSIAP